MKTEKLNQLTADYKSYPIAYSNVGYNTDTNVTDEELKKQAQEQEYEYRASYACNKVFQFADELMKYRDFSPENALEYAERYVLYKKEYYQNALNNLKAQGE